MVMKVGPFNIVLLPAMVNFGARFAVAPPLRDATMRSPVRSNTTPYGNFGLQPFWMSRTGVALPLALNDEVGGGKAPSDCHAISGSGH